MIARPAGASGLSDRVELVDEDQARRFQLGLMEQATNPCRADAHEHLDEIGAGKREEWHPCLTGDRLGQQRLTGPRRTDQKDSFGNPAADRLELLGCAEELDDLAQLGHGLIVPRDIIKSDPRLILLVNLGLASREGQGRAHAAVPLHDDAKTHHQGTQEDHGATTVSETLGPFSASYAPSGTFVSRSRGKSGSCSMPMREV